MKTQAYHTQILLADELDRYKEKEKAYADNHIKYKIYIKISIKKLNYLRQSIKENNKKIKYKTKKFSCINLMKYY